MGRNGALNLKVRTLEKNIRLNTTPPSISELKAGKRIIIVKAREAVEALNINHSYKKDKGAK
jgi:hypothetical protein